MPLVDLSATPLPNDDEQADAIDISGPISAILAVLNGHIDADNIEPGSLPWSVMDSFSNEIPATAMEDDGNVKKFRDESNIAFVASGLEWSHISGLNGTMTSGVFYGSDGSRNVVNAIASKTFTASRDTYVVISPAGAVDYQETTNGATIPTITPGYSRLAKVVTDGSAITSVTDMRITTSSPVKAGVFTPTAGTGSKTIKGLGFKPKVVEFAWLPATSSDRTSTMQGVADAGGGQWVTVSSGRDATAYRNTSTSHCIRVISSSNGAVADEAAFVSMDEDGFTLNFTLNNQEQYGYIAKG